MFNEPGFDNTLWYIFIAVIIVLSLATDNVVHRKIKSLYDRIVKKHPF